MRTYPERLIESATKNKLFENNFKGNYKIQPQHGINIDKFILSKNNEIICTFEIYDNGNIKGVMTNATKHEQKHIFRALKNRFPASQIIMQEYKN